MVSEAHRGRRGGPPLALALVAGSLALLAIVILAGPSVGAPNLHVSAADVQPAVDEPTKDTTTTVDVTVHCDDERANGVYVSLRDVTAASSLGKAGPYNLSANTSLKVTFDWDLTGASGGAHTLRAAVDPDGDVSESNEMDNSADLSVTVNLPPAVQATASMTFAFTRVGIDFSGNGSTDPDGVILQYLWYFGDGTVSAGKNIRHSYSDGSPAPGRQYNVTLVVTDNDGGVAERTLSVRIHNRNPTAVANGATVKTKTLLSIKGTASRDMDGKVTTFRWTLHNGTVVWGSPLVVSYDDDGLYPITLTVWDDDGATDSTSISIVVLNQAPRADVKANRSLVAIGEPITFDASASIDVDGVITNYTWIFGDRSTANGAVVEHTYTVNGSYNVTMVAVDDDGALSYASLRVIVGNTAPVAVAHASSGSVLTFEDVELNATSSIDVDGNIVSYAWDFGDGYSGMGAVVTHNYTDDGAYQVTLTVTDSAGAYGIGTVTVHVENRPPVAEFIDLEVKTGETAFFNGTYCSDMDGHVASHLWDLGGGLVYSTANATHSWDRPGKHTIVLTVWDDDGDLDSTSFNVTVSNRPPVASIDARPLVTTLSRPVTFNGSESSDPDGQVVNWTWSFGDGSRAYGTEVNHTYNVYGTYLATLTVRDDMGGINTTGVMVTVRNQPPVVSFNVTPVEAYTGSTLVFDGSNSSDPEDQIADFFWSFGDGGSGSGAVVSHSYTDDGRYTVRLTVVDRDAATAFMEMVVTILNRPPVAGASATPNKVLTLEEVTFKAGASTDIDGKVLWHRWDFGDGTTDYGVTAVHVFSDDGTYTVTLTITDDDGSEASCTVQMEVENRPPVSMAGPDQTTKTGIPVRLNGQSSYDLDGSIVEMRWDFGDGGSAEGPVVTHSFGTFGLYVVELTVIDDDGAVATSNLTVDVQNVPPVAKMSGDLVVLSGESMELDGSASYDLDGHIIEHTWDMGDGTVKYGQMVEHTYDQVGSFMVTLVVEDDGHLTSSIQVYVQVLNRRPRAMVIATDTMVKTGETVGLDASTSSDSDGHVVSYTWIFGDGSVAYGALVNHGYEENGIYMVVLTVTDNDGGTDSTSLFIQVENRPPLAAISGKGSGLTLVELEFDAEGTLDPDGRVVGYFWDFGDGEGANGWNVTHAYDSDGNHTVRLTVMDDDGRTNSTRMHVEVVNRPPVAAAEAPPDAMVNTTVRFDGTKSEDPDGLIFSWAWDFGDGATGEGREGYHKYTEPGTYTWTLTVTDDRSKSHNMTGSILVNPRPIEPQEGDGEEGPDESPGPGAVAAVVCMGMTAAAVALRWRGR